MGVGVRKLDELMAWRLSGQFKDEVYKLFDRHDRARRDFKYRDQIYDALSSTTANIAEGFHRNRTREFLLFLSYARASHAEAEDRLKDGIARRYFSSADCAAALLLAKRSGMAILRLIQSLQPFTKR